MTFRHRIGSLLTVLPACLLSVNGLQAQSCSTLTTVEGAYIPATVIFHRLRMHHWRPHEYSVPRLPMTMGRSPAAERSAWVGQPP